MSSLGSALVSGLGAFQLHPNQIPNKAFTSADAVAVAYMVLPGDGPLAVMDSPVAGEDRTERVRVSFMVRSRSYLAMETAATSLVRALDRVSQATWGGVLMQAIEVIGWQDTPMEPDTELYQRVVDARITYNEVA